MTSLMDRQMSEANQDLIARLTLRQRECLRLVAQGYSTKQIAQKLDVNDRRIAKDIDAANRLLGVSSRMDAARLLADAENRGVNVIPGIANPLPPIVPIPSSPFVAEEAVPPFRVREDRTPYQAGNDPPDLGWPVRPRGGASNVLSRWQRVIWVVLLSATVYLGLGAVAGGLSALSNHLIVPRTGGW